MDFLALHIHHLDDGEETEEIIKMLEPSGVLDQWPLERPTDETNAIFIPVNISDPIKEPWEIRDKKIKKSLELLRALSKEAIDTIKELQLSVSMRIHTAEHYTPLPEAFVSECGRLGIGINIFNTKAFKA